jgi:stage II sporulation protein D
MILKSVLCRSFWALFLLAFALVKPDLLSAMSSRPHPSSSWIRVAVMKGAKDLKIAIKGPYQLLTFHTGELLKEGKELRSTQILPTQTGFLIGKEPYKIYGLRIQAKKTKAILINGKVYRGLMDIIREEDQTLTVINWVGIEEYLYGVLRHEVAPWWPTEALKTQAIASRTYAVHQRGLRKDQDYDVTGDTLSQVYGGARGETWRIQKASQATWGKVLTWEGKPFPAYYSSTCGGHTESSTILWKTNLPPLEGRPCGYCELSPRYQWYQTVDLELIEKKLRWRKHDIEGIRGIEISEHTRSGRVKMVKIIHQKGTLSLPAHKFRMILGPNLIKSTLFTFKVTDHKAYFKGRGWGHGVGMCQWGVYGLARKGKNYKEILDFYYPGAEITQLEPKPNDASASLRDRRSRAK